MKSSRMSCSVPTTGMVYRLNCASATNTIIKGRIRQRTTVLLGTKTPAEDPVDSTFNRVYRWDGRRTAPGREMEKPSPAASGHRRGWFLLERQVPQIGGTACVG